MEYRRLGKSGLKVSALSFGSWVTFGYQADVGGAQACLDAAYEAGVYTNCVIPPGVSPGMALLRTSYMATHTDEQMDQVLETFETVGKKLGVI